MNSKDKKDSSTYPSTSSIALEELDSSSSINLKDSATDFPDGGLRAWLVVAGAVSITTSTFGLVNAWGSFQEYYQRSLLDTQSPSAIAWIGSIQYSLVFFPGLLMGRLFDIGLFRGPMVVCSVLLVVAALLVAECTVYWQFVVCQGLAVGLACGGLFGPTIAVVSHWFLRRRAIAIGITAIGSSIGGTIFPIAFRNLLPIIGFKWAARTLAFMLLFFTLFGNLTLRRRLPPQNVSGGLFNFAAFKSIPYSLYCASTFFCFLGIYTVLTYIDVSATIRGVSPSFSFYLIAIANCSSAFGRFFAASLSVKFGPLNILIPFTTIAAIMTFSWPYASSTVEFVMISLIYGFASGAFVGLLGVPVAALGETADVGRRTGMLCTLLSFGALAGPPISGAIHSETGDFKLVGVFAGSSVLVAVVLMVFTRWAALHRFVGGKF